MIKIYDTMSRDLREFVPIEDGKVKMYVCGPTVYNYIHVGNARLSGSSVAMRMVIGWSKAFRWVRNGRAVAPP